MTFKETIKNNLLVIFAREPVPGKVKTRLAKDVGAEAAAVLYDLMLRHVLKSVVSPRYDVIICKTTESRRACFERLVPGSVIADQPPGDIGVKMSGVFGAEFAGGYRKICVIGTDCPGISSSGILRAFDLLEKHELVLGPSFDGGYYLIGLSAFHPELFEGISWSTGSVFSETIEKARFLGIDHALLSVRGDIDNIAGLKEYIIRNRGTELSAAFKKVLRESGCKKEAKA